MVRVELSVERSASLQMAPEAAFAFLSDVPAWGALFPHVDGLELYPPAGASAFLWTMAPLGPPGAAVSVVYACRYAHDAEARTITWTPVEGVGNGQFAGRAVLSEAAGGTRGTFRLDAALDIPAPSFVRALVVPAVKLEFGRMVDTFVERLARLP